MTASCRIRMTTRGRKTLRGGNTSKVISFKFSVRFYSKNDPAVSAKAENYPQMMASWYTDRSADLDDYEIDNMRDVRFSYDPSTKLFEGVSSDGQSYSMIGGIVAGAAFVVGVSAFMIVKKRKTNRNKLVKKGDIESNGIMDRVTVVNPVLGESSNIVNNYSKRDLNNSFSPHQPRRSLI